MIAWLEVSTHTHRGDRLGHTIDAALRPLARVALAVAGRLAEWRLRARERDELARLDERLLRDAGITRYDALIEADKPFWRE